MDARDRAIKRAATILRGGLTPQPYRGITVIAVADSLLKDVLDQMAQAIEPSFKPGPAPSRIRIKGAE